MARDRLLLMMWERGGRSEILERMGSLMGLIWNKRKIKRIVRVGERT